MTSALKPFFQTGKEFNLAAQSFLQSVFFETDSLGVHFPNHWDVDHICYRVPNFERYQILKEEILKFADLLTEASVNERPISTFRLHEPILFGDYQINIAELPAPRAGRKFEEGFDHFEMVTDLPFQALANEFFPAPLESFLNRSDEKKVFNKELKLHLKTGTIKFHHLSLESITRLEKNKVAFKAFQSSKILERLYAYEPLFVGTFPLDLAIGTSDIDVVIGDVDLKAMLDQLHRDFGHHDLFSVREIVVQGVDTVLCAFLWDHFSFEIFAQRKPSVRQDAYLHFQVQERLLKLGSHEFQQKVRTHRQAGMKTEPAFIAALGVSGDPYAELLRLHTASNSMLQEYLRAARP